jgi:hypothetical protein
MNDCATLMNSPRAIGFRRGRRILHVNAQNRRRLWSYLAKCLLLQEIAMTQSDTRKWLTRAALAAALSSPVTLADVAYASQGPGGGMGTASHLTQVLMAILVYGTSGMIIAASLLRAARGR